MDRTKYTPNMSTGRQQLYHREVLSIIVSVRVMVFNVTFNNISILSWRLVLLLVETGENNRPATSLPH